MLEQIYGRKNYKKIRKRFMFSSFTELEIYVVRKTKLKF